MPVQPTSAARQRRCSGRGVFNSPTPNTGAASLDRGHGPAGRLRCQWACLPAEAAAHFSRMIEDSLSSWFTQWNFFFHNLAQKRHPGDQNETDSINSGELLSFIPKTYS